MKYIETYLGKIIYKYIFFYKIHQMQDIHAIIYQNIYCLKCYH